jgi:general secretion pathway protein J
MAKHTNILSGGTVLFRYAHKKRFLIARAAGTQGGFTLLEVLIALAVLGLILSTLFGVYTGTFRILRATGTASEIYAMAGISLERIREDLESVYLPPGSSAAAGENPAVAVFAGQNDLIGGNRADDLQFLSQAPQLLDSAEKRAGPTAIRYSVGENPRGEGLVLYRSEFPEGHAPRENQLGAWLLCDQLQAVMFTYRTREGEEFSNWDSSGESHRGELPSLVTIELRFMNRAEPQKPFVFMTSVALPMERNAYWKAFSG